MLGDALAGAGAALNAEIGSSLENGLPIALTVLGVLIGWGLFRRFVKA